MWFVILLRYQLDENSPVSLLSQNSCLSPPSLPDLLRVARGMRGTLGILQMVNVQADKQKLLHRFANESSQNSRTLRNQLCNTGKKKRGGGGGSITGAWRARESRTIPTLSHTAAGLSPKCTTLGGIQATGAPECTTVVVKHVAPERQPCGEQTPLRRVTSNHSSSFSCGGWNTLLLFVA